MRRVLFMLCFMLLPALCRADVKLPQPKIFVCKDAQCSIGMTGRPTHKVSDNKGRGVVGLTHRYIYTDDDVSQVLGNIPLDVAKLKALGPDWALDEFTTGIQQELKGANIKQSKATFAEQAGRLLQTTLPDNAKVSVSIAILVAKNSLYTLSYTGLTGADFDAKANGYFSSFKLITIKPLPAKWITYQNTEYQFKIKMPAKPEFQALKDGDTRIHMWTSESNPDKFVCIASYTDVKASVDNQNAIQLLLELGAKELLGEFKATPLETRWSTVEGKPALDILFEIGSATDPDSGLGTARLILSGNHFYQLLVVSSRSADGTAMRDATLDSFAFVATAASAK